MIILRYLRRLFSLWSTLIFTLLDIVALLVSSTVQSITFNPWVFWIVAGVGFLIANIQLFAEQEKKIKEYQTAEPKLVLNLLDSRIELRIDKWLITHDDPLDGLNDYGVPSDPYLVADVEIENLGKEVGYFDWELSSVEIGNYFVLDADEAKGLFVNFSGEVKGRERYKGKWVLKLSPCKSHIEDFANIPVTLTKYQVVMNYWTKKIGAKSTREVIIISGDLSAFVNDIASKWEKRGYGRHAQMIKEKQEKV